MARSGSYSACIKVWLSSVGLVASKNAGRWGTTTEVDLWWNLEWNIERKPPTIGEDMMAGSGAVVEEDNLDKWARAIAVENGNMYSQCLYTNCTVPLNNKTSEVRGLIYLWCSCQCTQWSIIFCIVTLNNKTLEFKAAEQLRWIAPFFFEKPQRTDNRVETVKQSLNMYLTTNWR